MREKLSATESDLAESSAALRAMEGEAAATALEWGVALARLEEENKALEAARCVTESHLTATRAELAKATTDALFPERPVSLRVAVVEKKEIVSLSLNVIQSPDDDGAEMAAAAEAAVRAARAETFAARDARDEAVTELEAARYARDEAAAESEAARARAAELASALAESREDGDARDARLASATAEARETERRLRAAETELRAELHAERALLASASSRLETQSAKTETLAARAEAAEEATRESVLRVGEEMRMTAQARAETMAIRAQLEKTLVALADAESRADEETTADEETKSQEAEASNAAEPEDVSESGNRGETSRDASLSSSKAKLASLRDELNARRAREAELEADAARLRAALDDAESKLVRLASDAEARRAEAAEAAAADAAEAAAAETRRRLSSSEAAAEHARSMLAAKELALADVEARARAAAEAAEAATRRSEIAEAAAAEAQREAAALAAERAAPIPPAPPDSSTPETRAAFGSVVDSWRSAVAAKAAEAERLRGSLSELLVSQTHAARLRKEAEARAAEAETERRDAESASESRLAALRQALGAAESARADADADAETYKRALVAAKEDCERLELEAAVSKHKNDEGTQAKLLIVQAESSELRAKVEKRNREVRELNRMLAAWEAMRHSKDAQIEKLVERCKKFEDEATEKARAVESMRKASRLGSGLKQRDGFPSSGRELSKRVALAPAVAAADKENPGSPGAAKLAFALEGKSPYGKGGSVSPASASLAAFKRKSHVPRADAVPGFRERLDSVVGR